MQYCEPLGISFQEILDRQAAAAAPFADAFEWKSEYLPLIIGFVGVVGIGLYMKIRKKKKGKGRGK